MHIRESTRLLIRPLTLGDAPFMLEQLSQPSWLENIGDRGVASAEDAAAYIESRILAQYRTLGYSINLVQLKATAEPVGVCGLVQRDYLPHPDLGFALLERHWGRGYTAEAGRVVLEHARQCLGIRDVLAITLPSNERSARVLMQLGFHLQDDEYAISSGEKMRLYALRLEP